MHCIHKDYVVYLLVRKRDDITYVHYINISSRKYKNKIEDDMRGRFVNRNQTMNVWIGKKRKRLMIVRIIKCIRICWLGGMESCTEKSLFI